MKKLLLCSLFFCSSASAATLPTLSMCLQSNGNIAVKQKCAKSEKKLSAKNISALGINGTAGPAGPQGPQGVAGSNGSVNFAGCHGIHNQCVFVGPGFCSASCSNGEFILQHSALVQNDNLLNGAFVSGSFFDFAYPATTIGTSIQYGFTAQAIDLYTAHVNVVCCPLN